MIKARYLVALAVCGVVAYRCYRGSDDDAVDQIDVNAHVCTAAKPDEVEKALTEQGFTATEDDRVKDARVIEVPEKDKEAVISALQTFQEQHPEWGIKIRTDKFNIRKKR